MATATQDIRTVGSTHPKRVVGYGLERAEITLKDPVASGRDVERAISKFADAFKEQDTEVRDYAKFLFLRTIEFFNPVVYKRAIGVLEELAGSKEPMGRNTYNELLPRISETVKIRKGEIDELTGRLHEVSKIAEESLPDIRPRA